MYADILPSEPSGIEETSATGMRGQVVLSFARNDGQARLKDLYQTSPFRVLFPTLQKQELTTAVLVTTSGGLVGGDRLDIEATIEADAAVQILGQAAEKVYKSAGPDTHFDSRLSVKEGGYLEWLPQETIVFDRARLRRSTTVSVEKDGEFSGAEMLVFGRTAMGETLKKGLVRDTWNVRVDGRKVWADALLLDGDIPALLDHPAGFNGGRAAATFVHVSPQASARLQIARDLLEAGSDNVTTGASVVNGVLIVRWLAKDAQPLRQSFGAFWSAFRAQTLNLPGVMPRLWHI